MESFRYYKIYLDNNYEYRKNLSKFFIFVN